MLDQIVGQMLAQRKLFLFHERNQAALEKLHREDHDAEHDDMQDKLRRVLADSRVLLRDRVRMACSFGAVFAALFMSGDAFEGCLLYTSGVGGQVSVEAGERVADGVETRYQEEEADVEDVLACEDVYKRQKNVPSCGRSELVPPPQRLTGC